MAEVKDTVEIKYKGNTLATMDTSSTKSLQTSGKYCEGNIEVIYNKNKFIRVEVTVSGGKSVSIDVDNPTQYDYLVLMPQFETPKTLTAALLYGIVKIGKGEYSRDIGIRQSSSNIVANDATISISGNTIIFSSGYTLYGTKFVMLGWSDLDG